MLPLWQDSTMSMTNTEKTENVYLTLMDQLEHKEGNLSLLDFAFNWTSLHLGILA